MVMKPQRAVRDTPVMTTSKCHRRESAGQATVPLPTTRLDSTRIWSVPFWGWRLSLLPSRASGTIESEICNRLARPQTRSQANFMMLLIIVSGLLAATVITEEVFPEIDLDRIRIQVPYLGAAPEEVDAGVVVRIEEAIEDIAGIKQIRSFAVEGGASVLVEFEFGADAGRMVDEVKNEIDAITTFPVGTEKPIIRELIARNQVIDIAIAGATNVFTLKTIAERVRDDLADLPEITQVDIVGAPPYEISSEVSEVALRRHRMTFDQVAEAMRRFFSGSARRLGPHRRSRDSATHDRASLPRRRVRGPRALDPSRRQPPAPAAPHHHGRHPVRFRRRAVPMSVISVRKLCTGRRYRSRPALGPSSGERSFPL